MNIMEKKVKGSFKDERGNVYKFYALLKVENNEVSIKRIDSLVMNDAIKIQPNFELSNTILEVVLATDVVNNHESI